MLAGDIPYWGANGVVDQISKALFDEELVLLGEDGAPFNDPIRDVAFRVRGPSWINNHIHVLRAGPGVDSRFLTYALNSVDWPPLITGSTRDKLTQDYMNRALIPMWALDKQYRIADFLDKEAGRIDRLIAAKFSQLDLLRERRQALVTAAATGQVGFEC